MVKVANMTNTFCGRSWMAVQSDPFVLYRKEDHIFQFYNLPTQPVLSLY